MSTEKTWEKYYKQHGGDYKRIKEYGEDEDSLIRKAYHDVYVRAILEKSGENNIALEVGCGSNATFDVLDHFKEIYFTDISEDALREAENNFKEFKTSSKVEFKNMNISEFTFSDNSLDVVFNTRGPHREETSLELMRTLKPGGQYVYQTIGGQDVKDLKLLFKKGRGYEEYIKTGRCFTDDVRDRLLKAGFKEEKIKLIFNDTFKSFFEDKESLKSKFWLILGDYDFEAPEHDKLIDQYIDSHTTQDGKIYLENHRVILKAVK